VSGILGTNNRRLDRYFANISARKRSSANWWIYAAVTSSAAAMATNASAGVIYFNQAVMAGPLSNVTKSNTVHMSQDIALKSANGGNIGFDFKIGVLQSYSASGPRLGFAFLDSPNLLLLLDNATGRLKKLAFGAHISTVHGIESGGYGHLASQITSAGVLNAAGWAANATGLAGFHFSTTNHTRDYGWVRLSYTVGTNGLANSITVTDWAYDPTGAGVTAGEGASSATPEPCTTALAILAAGAAGVAALRRRRRESGENLREISL
jgi:hypothetical protein